MKIQKRSRKLATSLPDDVVMEILSRMPAHDVLKCGSVCRRWRVLISNPHFREMHLKAKACHSSMILAQRRYEKRNELLLLDKWEYPRKRTKILRFRPNFMDISCCHGVKLSYDGLFVMNTSNVTDGFSRFTVMNPISGDVVRVEIQRSGVEVLGMFFNPLTKEYCIILSRTYRAGREFQILNLGAQPCCRPLKQSVSLLGNPCGSPVVIDDATIYWLVGDSYDGNRSCEELIMAFDIKTEVFTFLPHPDPIDDCHILGHWNMHIINIDGRLSFVQSKITHRTTSLMINVWALKDTTAVTIWIKTHSFSIDIDRFDIPKLTRFTIFRILALGKGVLLLLLHYSKYSHQGIRRVYAYSLDLGTITKVGKTYEKINSNLSTYVPSFVSLRDCKPKICISPNTEAN